MLKVKGLTIQYGQRTILNEVNADFLRGMVTVIKGDSGSGKSSLLHVMGLMQSPKKIEYSFDGKDISNLSDQEKANFRLNNIGFVFQQSNLVQELSAIENIKIPLNISGKEDINQKAESLINYVGLNVVKNSYPSNLSGGEEQRLAIARAIANDADIILADEPTAALDNSNSKKVLDAFAGLAHDLNKIVVIVSHDSLVSEYADIVYEVKNEDLIKVREASSDSESPDVNGKISAQSKRKVFSFIKKYNKLRTSDKNLNRFFAIATSLIAAIAILFANFGDNFMEGQNNFINAISDKSVFLINDSLGLNLKHDYEDALAMSDSEIERIMTVPGIDKVYPFYSFPSYGFTQNTNDAASLRISDNQGTIKELKYQNTYTADASVNQFAVIPLFPEENIEHLLEYKSADADITNGVYLTKGLAQKISNNPEDIINKTLSIQCFVPIKLYDSYATKPKAGEDHSSSTEQVPIDGAYYKNVIIETKIAGVLSNSYTLQRTAENDYILLPYSYFEEILTSNTDTDYDTTNENFPEKKLSPSAFVVFANTYEDVPVVTKKLELISSSFSIVNSVADIKSIQDNLSATKKTMSIVTILFIGIIAFMFGFLYYLKNRSRKKEIGILKAIGLTRSNVLALISHEMIKISFKSLLGSIILALIVSGVGNKFLGIEIFSLNIYSLAVGLFVNVIIVVLSGIIPVYSASKVDPVEAIRKINK